MTSTFIRSRRTRIVAFASVAIATLLVVWAIVANGRSGRTAAASPPAKGTAGMTGMTTSANGTVQLSAEQIRQFGITFGTAEVRALVAETRTTGVVMLDETRIAQVSPKIGGFVERLYVNATGQPVSRGQPLLELYSPDLLAAQQELLLSGQLQRDMGRSAVPGVPGGSTDLLAASRRRLQLLDISEAQIDEVLRTGHVRRTLTLYAPTSGVVTEKKVLQGQAITAGEALFTIADMSGVWIDVQLREADASAVRIGTGADIMVAGLPERTLKGTVAYVYPTLDSMSRAVRARVTVANPGGALKPGMYATVRLTTPSRTVLSVPSSAILRTGERNVVFMDMGKGALMPMDVRVGRVAGEYSEILSGLDAGARVVTSAQFLLDSESNLGEVMKSMIGQGGGSAQGAAGVGDMGGMSMPASVTPKR
jgi:multidrug efflux pump subunit AcrA (membrane-fusion protein)